ncbi:MAG: tRNA (adenosine(37)-N6)-dimethylallyltransferase MiaA [Pseudomonadota bacterium]
MAGERPVLLAGPTGSGKSGLALALAERLGGVVVNADSQQVYGDWRVLTARPSVAEEARAPHRLYGFLALDAPYSVGQWLRDLAAVLAQARATGQRPIVVGGTGLYFTALTEGLAEIPPVPPETRAAAEARLATEGLPALAAALAARDPATAKTLDLANPARVLRAWEVLEATGRGLAAWQADTPPPLIPPGDAVRLALDPPVEALDRRLATRFRQMLATGALAEAEAVAALTPDPAWPGMKALGAAELVAYVRGTLDLETATERAILATRRYAKRQRTWIRGRLPDWQRLETRDPEAAFAALDTQPVTASRV